MAHRFSLASALVVLLLTGCALRDGGAGSGAPGSLDGKWQLVEGSYQGTPLRPIAGASLTFEIDGNNVRGTSGCNMYSGTLVRNGESIRLQQLMTTDMACPRHNLMNLEASFTAALGDVRRVEGSDAGLVLTGQNSRLVFEPQRQVPDADLVGTSWQLETLVNGETAASTVNGAPATLVLDPSGSFKASTGCRTVTGRYALDGTRLRLTLDPYDAFGCAEPIGMQDAFVLGFLDGAYQATINGRQLTLGSGQRQLVYNAG
jgi:heat shock protein HslJ